MEEERLFLIVDNKTGQKWEIFKNGKITGFNENCYVINNIPRTLAESSIIPPPMYFDKKSQVWRSVGS